MTDYPILSIVTFLPLVGVLFILFVRGDEPVVSRNSFNVALLTSAMTFIVSLFIWFGFDGSTAAFQFVEKAAWMAEWNINYHMGVDGISVFFVILSTFLTPLCILSAKDAIKKRMKEYMIAFLVLETLMIGMFCALDYVLFYVFFEGVLIPMFIIIGVWGGPRRVYAAYKLFLYTLLGSVLMLVALMVMYFNAGTTDIPTLMKTSIDPGIQTWLWLALFASFAVKIPMWPVHTWLPDAHVEAPTAGSVILAGVLLKMGGYGFLRLALPILPVASDFFAPLIFTLSAVAVVYTSLVALVQADMKKLIAYSSIAHMGFVTIGMFAMNQQGIEGSIFQMLSHGVVSGALFLCVGVVYDRLHTREIARYGGLSQNMPKYAMVFLLFTMASAGLPGTAGFVGEFLVLTGIFQTSTWATLFAATGLILGACYSLVLYRGICFGKLTRDDVKAMVDMTPREIVIFVPLILVTLWMGIHPSTFLEPMHPSVMHLIDTYRAALAAHGNLG